MYGNPRHRRTNNCGIEAGSAAAFQSGVELDRIQRPRPRRGTGSQCSDSRAAEIPFHLFDESGRILHGSCGGAAGTARDEPKLPLAGWTDRSRTVEAHFGTATTIDPASDRLLDP